MLILLLGMLLVGSPCVAQIPAGCSQCETAGDTMVLGTGCGNTTVTGGSVFIANSTQPLYFRGQRTDNWAFFARTTPVGAGSSSFAVVLDSVYEAGDDPGSPTYAFGAARLNRDGNYLACYYVMAGNQASGQVRDAYLSMSNPTVGSLPCRTRETSAANTIQSLSTCCLLPNQNAGDTVFISFSQTGTNAACPDPAYRCTMFLQLLAGSGGD